MSRRFWILFALLLVVVALNIMVVVTKTRRDVAWARVLDEARTQETERLARTYRSLPRLEPLSRNDDYFSGIGGLARSRYWTKKLPLADAQIQALNKLDNLVWQARLNSYGPDADYLETDPADYVEHLDRSHARRSAAIDHAVSMVKVGLLTEPQRALVVQNDLAARGYWINVLRYRGYFQDLLVITEKQQQQLAQLGEEGRAQRSQLDWFPVAWTTVDRKVADNKAADSEAFNARVAEIQVLADAEVKKILTSRQRDLLDQLAAGPKLPLTRPNLRALPDVEDAQFKLDELSPIFRAAGDEAKALNLSKDQQQLLSDLRRVVRNGLFWISEQNSEDAPERKSKFIKHAEQVALQGILTESQARQVDDS